MYPNQRIVCKYPISYGKTEDHSVIEEYSLRTKILWRNGFNHWRICFKTTKSQHWINRCEVSAYANLCKSIGNSEVGESQRGFMTVQLKKSQNNMKMTDGLNIYLDDQVDSLDHRLHSFCHVRTSFEAQFNIFLSKGDAIQPFSELIQSLELAGKVGWNSLPKDAFHARHSASANGRNFQEMKFHKEVHMKHSQN